MKNFIFLTLTSTLLFSCSTIIKQIKPTQVKSEEPESNNHLDEPAKQPGKEASAADEPKQIKPPQEDNAAQKAIVHSDEKAKQAVKESLANENALTPYPPDYEKNFKADFDRGYDELKAAVQSYEELSRSKTSLTVEALSRWKKNYDHIIANIFGVNVFFAAGGSPESAKHYAIWPRYLKSRIEALKQLKIINRKCDDLFSDDVAKELQSHYELFDKEFTNCEQVLPSALKREAQIVEQRLETSSP